MLQPVSLRAQNPLLINVLKVKSQCRQYEKLTIPNFEKKKIYKCPLRTFDRRLNWPYAAGKKSRNP